MISRIPPPLYATHYSAVATDSDYCLFKTVQFLSNGSSVSSRWIPTPTQSSLPTPLPPVPPSLPNTPTETVVHHSSEKSTATVTVLDAEKQVNPWDGYEEDEMPEKKQPRLVRNLRLQAFSIYRRLFSIVFLTNIGIFISYAIRGYHSQKIALVAVANIFIAILMREEHVINALFAIACSVPQSWPFFIRKMAARVYHNGGVHSGAAVSGTVWLILLAVQATRELVQGKGTSVTTVALTYIVLAFLVGIVVFAYPTFRIKRHDAFERMHRFMGWTATALVWSQGDKSLGHALVHSAPFWLMMVLSWSLILPWARLQKVPVRSVVLSNHAVHILFPALSSDSPRIRSMSGTVLLPSLLQG
ncbi:hypothetical protein EDD18DRAFT_1099436 [Armillaria luteobubalina]|uniref:Uncharacterized protein n=1 Tax=Armillaria luteobubalina TaxID=153913 RepID=A0AA39QJR4_9AGAR|nr:hypothetical protein EDD18DRAFT_1099436 [Armillaria luteobubalina]